VEEGNGNERVEEYVRIGLLVTGNGKWGWDLLLL
jgi:hypothetical protein